MKQLHDTQIHILQKLLFAKDLRYSDMRPEDEVENNRYDFHLKQLISLKLVEKQDQKYSLTTKGKEYANRIDTDDSQIKRQSKIGVWVAPMRQIDCEWEVLIYKRLKNPFYGKQGFMTGKLQWGETLVEGAKREMLEETGLTGDLELVLIRHYINKSEGNDEVIEDKFLHLFRVLNPQGDLVTNEEGEFKWVKENEFEQVVVDHFDSFERFIADMEILKDFDGNLILEETVQYPEGF